MTLTKARKPAREDVVESFDCDQRGDEWFHLHLGICSGSNFSTVMADGRHGEDSKTRTRLLYKKAAEILSGIPAESYSNERMRKGIEMEPTLIQNYAFARNVQIERVGFVRRTIHNSLGEDLVMGCSPDALVGTDGVLEIKSMDPDLLVQLVDSGRFPTEHKWQTHGSLCVTGRAWCDLQIGYDDGPGRSMPLAPIYRIQRDESLIAELKKGVEVFMYELRQLVTRVKQKGGIR